MERGVAVKFPEKSNFATTSHMLPKSSHESFFLWQKRLTQSKALKRVSIRWYWPWRNYPEAYNRAMLRVITQMLSWKYSTLLTPHPWWDSRDCYPAIFCIPCYRGLCCSQIPEHDHCHNANVYATSKCHINMTLERRYLFVWLLRAGPSLRLGHYEFLVNMKPIEEERSKLDPKQTKKNKKEKEGRKKKKKRKRWQ